MIPSRIAGVTTNMILSSQPSLTYKLDIDKKRIAGKADGIEAMKIAVAKILTTERYSRVIYTGQYGVELERMIGQDYNFIASDIERTLNEALLADDRIFGIASLEMKQVSLNSLEASFTVKTVFGELDFTTEVTVA